MTFYRTFLTSLLLFVCASSLGQPRHSTKSYLGFDRNRYPGDAQMAKLRNPFAFTGYWLNNPPGESTNSWTGKRRQIERMGFGFVILFNGRTYASIRNGAPAAMGRLDGVAAAKAAAREGFPKRAIVFLDQEEGGRLLPEQRSYLHAWVDAVNKAGYRAGVYCSGIAFQESDGSVVITASDIRSNAGGRRIAFWVSNDACPPSPGCTASHPPSTAANGLPFVDIWQYAQSPSRKNMTTGCAKTYSPDGECYAPGFAAERLHVDLNVATSPDPSGGRGGH